MRIRLLPTLLVLFVLVPLLDMITLLAIGKYVGFWPTVLLVIVCGVTGARLAKSQGLRVWRSIQEDLAAGRMPSQGLLDSVMILVAGGLLIAPGFLTYLAGLLLLVPAVRAPIKAYVRRRLEQVVVHRVTYGVDPSHLQP